MNVLDSTDGDMQQRVQATWGFFLESAALEMNLCESPNVSASIKDALAGTLEKNWRSFIALDGVGLMKKGYAKRCANSFAMMLVNEKGPSTLLALLLSEFNVNANCKDSTGTTLLTKAFDQGDASNIKTLMVGCGTNKALIDDFKSIDLTLCKNRYSTRSNILSAVAMPTGRCFDETTGTYVDSTTSVVSDLLDRGATLYNNFIVDHFNNGWSTWCYVAHYGNVETMKLLLQTHKNNSHVVHMNAKHNIAKDLMYIVSMPPMLFTTKNLTTTAADTTCKPCQWDCNASNCNMPMIKMFIDNGANPHICAYARRYYAVDLTGTRPDTRKVYLSLCTKGRGLLGLVMYERVQRHRHLVTLTLQRAKQHTRPGSRQFPDEVLALICQHAGIGEAGISDTKTPWVPTMPVRTQDKESCWYGAYTEIDNAVLAQRASRRS
ncbi:hypothetical protein T484DRAFT_1753817 [Baffinella frigidus]|nr:hypothetical protein T484DRAFT_1753817 [Cryptophyta sp. CCMP2293]